MTGEISVLIPTKNPPEYLDLCLSSIKRNSHFDNQVLVHRDNENVWYKGNAAAYNLLASQAIGEWLLIAQDDIVLMPDWDRNLLRLAQINSHIVLQPRGIQPFHGGGTFLMCNGGVTPKTFDENKVLQCCRNNFVDDILYEPPNLLVLQFILKNDFLSVGGMDSSLPNFLTLDLLVRLGKKTGTVGSSFFYHFRAHKSTFSEDYNKEQERRFMEKHKVSWDSFG